MGGPARPNYLVSGFCEALSDAGLMDLVQLGSSFTYNYREGTDHCMREKLDRACSTIS